MTPAKLAIHTDGAVSCAAVLWRFGAALQLTVVVKATFAITPDGVAAPVGPGEIVAEDRHVDGSPFRSVVAASNLAPYLPRCDVLFAGHAHAVGEPVAAAAVRLGVARQGQWLLDKTIHVHGDRGPTGAPEPFARMPIVYERAGGEAPNLSDPGGASWPAGFGPISRFWSERRAVLGPIDPALLDRSIPAIPEEMPWEYFQAAPPDQRIEMLHGGEWLVLEGLDPELARVQTRLPPERAVVCIAERRPGTAGLSALDLACDTLAIDGDHRTFSLTWRGVHEVAGGDAALPSRIVLAAMETPGVPVDWERLLASPASKPRPPATGRRRPRTLTEVTSPSVAMPRAAALPFQPSGASPRPPSTDATPWAAPPLRPPPATVGVATQLGLGMRLSSAPLSSALPPPLPVPEPALLQPLPFPEEEEELDTLTQRSQLEPKPEQDPAPEPEPVPEPEPAPPRGSSWPWSDPPPPAPPVPVRPDPWARSPEGPPPAPAPSEAPSKAPKKAPPPPPRIFERPATAAMMGSFYSKFGRK